MFNRSLTGHFTISLDRNHAGEWMKLRRLAHRSYRRKRLRLRAGHQNIVLRAFLLEHRPHNVAYLLRRLSFCKHNFRKTLPHGPVVVYFCEIQVFKRQMIHTLQRLFRRKLRSFHFFQNFQKLSFFHGLLPQQILSFLKSGALLDLPFSRCETGILRATT